MVAKVPAWGVPGSCAREPGGRPGAPMGTFVRQLCGNHPSGVRVFLRTRRITRSGHDGSLAVHDRRTTDRCPVRRPRSGTRVGRNTRAAPGDRKHHDQQGAHDVRPVGSKYLLEEPLGTRRHGHRLACPPAGDRGCRGGRRRAARRDRGDQGPQGGAGQRRGRRDALPARALRPAAPDPPEHRAHPRPGRRGRSPRPRHGPGRRPRPAPLPPRERPASPRSPPRCSPPRSRTRSPPATPTASSTAT